MSELAVNQRLRGLIDAGLALASELSLDALLRRLLELAAELTGARYAALGVIDPNGARLERFLTHGIDPDTEAAIGTRPEGRGILGLLMRETKPLRLEDISAHPQSVGFPHHHPPMRSFLGVPILLRGTAFGNLYLTEKAEGGPFTAEDEGLVSVLAAQAAVAIENVRLYEAATRWAARLESLNEVGNALALESDLDVLLDLVARRLRELLGSRYVNVLLPSGSDELRFAAVAGPDGDSLLGTTLTSSGSKSGRTLAERRSERVDSLLDDPEVDQVVTRKLGASTGLWVPLIARGRAIGVLAVHDKLGSPDGRFSDDDLRLAQSFAARAAVAVDLSQRVARAALGRVVAAQELERRRLARELHDETGQALTSILLGLRGLEQAADPDDVRSAVANLRALTVRALADVRRLAVELRPRALDDFGLAPALERLVDTWRTRTGIEIELVAQLGGEELKGDPAVALYRIVQEALVNVVKHAHARRVSIRLTRKNARVLAVIEDAGQGFDPNADENWSGIHDMRDRVELLGGQFRIESAEGSGTTLVIEMPVG